jgi:hypothetical protein
MPKTGKAVLVVCSSPMRIGETICAVLMTAACGGGRTSTQVPGGGASTQAPADGGTSASTTASTNTKTRDAGNGLPVSVATAKAHSDGNHYALEATANGTVSHGGTGALEIVMVAKDGYHVNDEFPYKLKTSSDPAGIVTFEVPELNRSDGRYTKTEARFQVKFVGARPGVAKIGGTMALSVCTKKECITDRVALELPVTVLP